MTLGSGSHLGSLLYNYNLELPIGNHISCEASQQSVDREGRSDMGEVGRRQKGGSPIVTLYKPTSEKKTKKHPQKAESQKPSFIFTSLALLQFSFFHEKCHCQSLENLVKHVNQVKYVIQVSQVHLLLHLLIHHHLYHHLHDH